MCFEGTYHLQTLVLHRLNEIVSKKRGKIEAATSLH